MIENNNLTKNRLQNFGLNNLCLNKKAGYLEVTNGISFRETRIIQIFYQIEHSQKNYFWYIEKLG
jgi:hypothetical protein